MKVVPELLCTDIHVTKAFYTEILGFQIKYERPEESFIYFTLDGVDVMCEQVSGSGRRWITGQLVKPYGRGINLQWEVSDVTKLYQKIVAARPSCIYMEMENRTYRCKEKMVQQRQFIIQDPDGYLFRFCD